MAADARYIYEIGTHLPGTPYLVEKALGAGGMGVVYAVRHSFLNRCEAVKTIHPELIDRADIAQRMKQEAEVLSNLRHPNIVQVTGGGVIDDQWRLPYFAMEMLNGKSLREMIRRRALSNVESIYIIAYEMLDALAEAHAAGIVHRDVKPENIFIHKDVSRSAGPRVSTKLLDFGIMAVLGGRQSRQFRGTFKYAAPEQLRGDRVSPQTDLYAAALVIYEMLAGRGPFDDIRAWREVGRAHLEREPPPLSSFVAIPASLDRLLMAALSKDPTKRPESAMAFAQQLYVLKQIAESRPFAPAADPTEETLLTAIFPTEDPQPGVGESSKTGPAGAQRSPRRWEAARSGGGATLVDIAAPAAVGGTLENLAPPSGMSDRVPRASLALEKTELDRTALTRTLESLSAPEATHGTDPILSGEEFDPPGAPDSTLRYMDPELDDAPAPAASAGEEREAESNVTPPPVSRPPQRGRVAADAAGERWAATYRRRRRGGTAALAVLGVGLLAWAAIHGVPPQRATAPDAPEVVVVSPVAVPQPAPVRSPSVREPSTPGTAAAGISSLPTVATPGATTPSRPPRPFPAAPSRPASTAAPPRPPLGANATTPTLPPPPASAPQDAPGTRDEPPPSDLNRAIRR